MYCVSLPYILQKQHRTLVVSFNILPINEPNTDKNSKNKNITALNLGQNNHTKYLE